MKTAREIIAEKLEKLSERKTGLSPTDYMLLLINTCIEGAEEYGEQSRQAAVSGALPLAEIAQELWQEGRMIKAIRIISEIKQLSKKEAKEYCEKNWKRQ